MALIRGRGSGRRRGQQEARLSVDTDVLRRREVTQSRERVEIQYFRLGEGAGET